MVQGLFLTQESYRVKVVAAEPMNADVNATDLLHYKVGSSTGFTSTKINC